MKTFKRRFLKTVAVYILLSILTQLIYPTVTYALTSGPSQPEVQSFEPIGTTEMVDLFSGDFNYNIPLFELSGPNGGYPFNLHYNAGITMEEEASWVGLGWNLNPGAINRQMRGLPDELNGTQKVRKESYMKPNVTYGVGVGAGFELFGADSKKALADNLSLSVGLTIFYNNYKGVGYSVDPTLAINSDSKKFSGNLGLSLNSQEGTSAFMSLSYNDNRGNKERQYNLGLDYNSNAGLMGISAGMTKNKLRSYTALDKNDNEVEVDYRKTNNKGGSSSYSFSGSGYTPSISAPMISRNITLSFKYGGDLWGFLGNGYVKGFYNSQRQAVENEEVAAYGYMHMAPTNTSDCISDFNRSKDGMLHNTSPNLPPSTMTFDNYSMTGHGMMGMFRPYRNDISVLHDRYTKSNTFGGSLGVEFAPGFGPHFGGDLELNYGESVSGRWDDKRNEMYNKTLIANPNNKLYEASYFKLYGETTYDSNTELAYIGNEDAVRLPLENAPDGADVAGGEIKAFYLRNKYYSDVTGNSNLGATAFNDTEVREPRGTVIDYIDKDPSKGMYSISTDGTKYKYGLPAMVKGHVECQFAVGALGSAQCRPTINLQIDGTRAKHKHDNTDQYYNKTTLPDYAHAYLLEEITGPDYVDADDTVGVSAGDFGYWVKFEYTQVQDYGWRMPYAGASYSRGMHSSAEDDKGSYVYGKKDLYFLKKARTKTHTAQFITSDRIDARGSGAELINNTDGNLRGIISSKQLDRIDIYAREGNVKLKSVNFVYDNSLCKGIPNNILNTYSNGQFGATSGKLTLTKVYFTYENNTRGALSPYEFTYANNPNYSELNYDRWGTYKAGAIENACANNDFPYTKQFDNSNSNFRSTMDNEAAAWSLSSIKLPSGGLIKVDYESDDYAYVQNKRAMQMFKIKGFGTNGDNIITPKEQNDRKIFFELETPLDIATNNEVLRKRYLDGITKLYFKAYVELRGNNRTDYVSGYADIDYSDYGFDPSTVVNGKFTQAYVKVNTASIGSRTKGGARSFPYHPICLSAWQFIRSQNPILAGVGPFNDDPNSGASAALNKIKSLANAWQDVLKVIVGYFGYADSQGWARSVILDKSYIRLCSPDKVKLGGGIRVKKIEFSDNWNVASTESDSKYGQVYQYTMQEGGETISSGVAAYEPTIGGDEIPHRVPREYTESIPVRTDNNLYFEYPVNEDLYPGATVGYRNVVVKSLATHYASTEVASEANYNIPDNILKSGAQVHEFYTAKEFPVIETETPISMETYKLYIPIPLIGEIMVNTMSATQGYSTILNDMHGKLKKMSTYSVNANGTLAATPESYVEYTYKADLVNVDKDPNNDYYKLNNLVDVILGDNMGANPAKQTAFLSQDYDFYTDMRYFQSTGIKGGAGVNVDIIFVIIPLFPFLAPIPVGSVWPSISSNKIKVQSAVANKIIHRAGILSKTTAYDGSSYTTTENLVFDGHTGRTVLTKVNNNYNEPLYNYTVPAHYAFDQTGPASAKLGADFKADIAATATAGIYSLTLVAGPDASTFKPLLKAGDQLEQYGSPSNRFYLEYVTGTSAFFKYPNANMVGNDQRFRISKSSNTNQLSGTVSSITSLSDPLTGRVAENCTTQVNVPQQTAGFDCITFNPTAKATALKGVELINLMLKSDVDGNFTNDYYQSGANAINLLASSINAAGVLTKNYPIYYNKLLEMFEESVPATTPKSFKYQGGLVEQNQFRCCPEIYDNSYGASSYSEYNYNYVLKKWSNNTDFIEQSGWDPGFFIYGNIYNGLPAFAGNKYGPKGYEAVGGRSSFCELSSWGIKDSYNPDTKILPNNCATTHNLPNVNIGYGKTCAGYPFFTNNSDSRIMNGIGYKPGTGLNTALLDNNGGLALKYAYDQGVAKNYDYAIDRFDLVEEDCTIKLRISIRNGKNSNGSYNINTYDINGITWSWFGQVNHAQTNTTTYSKPVSTPVITTNYKSNDILSISASPASDMWPLDLSVAKKSTLSAQSSFENKFKGVWRGEEAYAYVDNRSQQSSLNLKADGKLDNVKLYNFSTALNDACFPQWRKANTITKYSPYSYELENKDILNLNSSAIYGYNGNLTTALASNAGFNELAFEGFEEHTKASVGLYNTSTSTTPAGNFTFYTNGGLDYTNYKTNINYTIESAKDNNLLIDCPFNTAKQLFTSRTVKIFGAQLNSYHQKNINGEYLVSAVLPYTPSGDPLYMDYNKCVIVLNNLALSQVIWKGKVSVEKAFSTLSPKPRVDLFTVGLSNSKAHTGKNSLKQSSGYGFTFEQINLNLSIGKKYVFSAWVSADNTNRSTFALTNANGGVRGVELYFCDDNYAQVGTSFLMQPAGLVIEGWQQVQGTLTVPAKATKLLVKFSPASNENTYWDDIRIHPFDANFQSYVYDPNNYRLKAVLDNNNFATLYYYDEQGALYLVKKETERGIQTIQESINHTRE